MAASNGAKTSIDIRGFGAFATANTLILVNGRRLNDIDMAQVDLSTIPLQSIERIEITRGNSGAVLYGDNAVGGVVNIVLKNGVGGPPVAMRAEAGVGSFNQRLANISVATNSGPWSTSFYGNAIKSDGYRENNALDQRNGVGNLNYTTPDLKAFLTVTGDDQKLGLPGGRIVSPSQGINDLVTNRRGADTPFDYANQQGASATAGFTKTLWNGAELIVDGGVRKKDTQGAFFGTGPAASPLPSFSSTYNDATLQTWSITPRLSIKNSMFGMPSQILTGIDYYDATFNQERGAFRGLAATHTYDLSQQTVAGYWQQTLGLLPTTDFSYGARVQNTSLSARDRYDPNAPGCATFFNCDIGASPLNSNETQYALHAGLEHRFNDVFSVFGRAARAFRTPTVDERVSSGPAFGPPPFFPPIPGDFGLKTQTSHDIEGGFRVKSGGFQMQTSIYNMDLENEIQFNPVLFFNTNLDPTRRYGSETSASLRVTDTVTASRRHGLHPRRVSRGPVRRQGRAAGVALHRERRRDLEHLAELPRVRCHGARLERARHGQRPGEHAAAYPGERNRRSETERCLRSLLLVGRRHQFVRCAVLRLRHCQHVHARPLCGLSAARTDLHGEGRRDVLIQAAGSACCHRGDPPVRATRRRGIDAVLGRGKANSTRNRIVFDRK